jgi:hypothetical protein
MNIPQDDVATEKVECKPFVMTQSATTLPVFVFKDGKLDRAGTLSANRFGQPRLQVVHGRKRNKEYPLKDGVSLLGRPIDCAVDIDMSELEPENLAWSSRRHALVIVEDQKVYVHDCNSRNGTLVNGQKIPPAVRFALNADDLVQIGAVQFRVQC